MKNILKLLKIVPIVIFVLTISSCTQKQKYEQAVLGVRSAEILNIDDYQFKDLNKNGELDNYEDWRLSIDERVGNLLSQMTLEEKVGFMLISTINMGGSSMTGIPGGRGGKITSDLSEEETIMKLNFFTRKPLPAHAMFVSGTTKGINERHLRHFILRANTEAKTIAEWSNKVQALAENTRLGIPVILASNPRNHVSIDNSTGLGLGETVFSKWPGELGLAAMRDFELTREFAETAAKEWVSVGIRKGYQYMADLATEPRWGRTEGTFGENAELAANMIREITLGFQGEKLGNHSVALTTKHFPGGGPQVDGQDPHFDWGKDQHYPGDMFDYHLKPFVAAIEAGTSAIMPYYAKPINSEHEEIAFAYNKGIINDLLRGELGFQGIINSDTGPIYMMPWGAEDLSIHERYQKALEAGVDIFSGIADPTKLLETVKMGLVADTRIDESVTRLLKEKFELGIFENPYVNVVEAESIVGNEQFQESANLAFRKSIVLLKNEHKVLPLKSKTKVYFEKYMVARGSVDHHNIVAPEENSWDVEFVNSADEADVNILWLIPKTGGLFGSTGAELNIELSNNNIDVEYVNKIKAEKPTVIVINFSNPWVISEIDTGNANTILATFGTTTDALLDVLTGKFNPTGKMPFSIPSSTQFVLSNKSDVPGYLESEGYALFKFDDGISY
ncbi:MAG: glycoside hydrolase family 3 protein [Prolixibacteraceae bacterium]|jgi:beta-glucosidase|nr:glycoside hydrolase family 3 protein [Prolixibacteraceae bacterium]MBT6005196.1 glycoside hydrolase family 3 protein [Prolixibacteraceae bacterium]MBT6766088.1 glycoside hydrolase family 3 protein [Prolixibacteraceae bacterium]MBT6996842.1 glycoside hydrolase family 3 protein [Prolixibacteraceae bacterium]MBT7395275.1 glycoside hydrolase family 3 protein [Prolixibacteraceae bacterium]